MFFVGSMRLSFVDLGVMVGAGLESNASGMKKLSPSPPVTSGAWEIAEWRLLRYVDDGSVRLSLFVTSVADRSGERSRRELLLDDEPFRGYPVRGRGDNSVGVSVSTEPGVSGFGLKAPCGIAFGGRAGRDLSMSNSFSFSFDCATALDFFLRLAISDSWQLMQKIPCEVLAYRRFSILRLQFLQRKQVAQNAWSPVRIAKSSILFPHALQL